MNNDIWSQTYRADYIPNQTHISVVSAVHGTPHNHLVARMVIRTHGGAIGTEVIADLTPAQMRSLADALTQHAERIDTELMPLIYPEPDLIPFTLYTEPEAA